MSDWQSVVIQPPVISTCDVRSGGVAGVIQSAISASVTWPAINRALYMPFEVQEICTVYQIGFQVAVQSGNLDVGIYRVDGSRIVSKGSTAVAAAGVQVVDITNTELVPGVYFLAMCVDNTTAAFAGFSQTAPVLQCAGMQQQAVGAVTLPDPATFANPATSFTPQMFASNQVSTI